MVRNLYKLCLALTLLYVPCGDALFARESPSIKEVVARIPGVAVSKKSYKLTEKEKALIQEIAKLGPEALPFLMDLMASKSRAVQVVAAEAIESISDTVETVDPKYLPVILQGLDQGHNGLPNVLEKIKTPEARREFVRHYLADSSSPHNQYPGGFRRYGIEFLPYMIEEVRSGKKSDDQSTYFLCAAVAEFSEADRKTAAHELLKAFGNDDTSVESRRVFLVLIGGLGAPALEVEDQLAATWREREEFRESAADALIGMRSRHAGEILAERLKADPNYLFLRDIAEIGAAAQDAGPEVGKLLDGPDWDLRLGAARTLGFIGYRGAAARLIELVDEPSDVRLNYVAVESLGRLLEESALPVLKIAALEHWHPNRSRGRENCGGEDRIPCQV